MPLKILESEKSSTFTGLTINQGTCVFLEKAQPELSDLRIGASPADGTKGIG